MKNYESYRKYVNFLDRYKNASNASTGSEVDSNANVSSKNISTCQGEMTKTEFIGANRLMMMDKIKELYDEDLANEYIRQLDAHEIYKHDETSISPYTYDSKETVMVKLDNVVKLVAFEDLYELCKEEEVLLDSDKIVYAKYPKNIKIIDKNGETNVIRLIKKKRHRDLVCVKTKGGENIVVTDNHPLIVNDDINNTKQAIDSLGFLQYRNKFNYDFISKNLKTELPLNYTENYGSYVAYREPNIIHYSQKSAKLNIEFGYFVGFFIAEGWYRKNKHGEIDGIVLKQKDKDILYKCSDYLYKATGITSSVSELKDQRGFYNLNCTNKQLINLLINEFQISEYAINKKLPIDLFSYSDEFKLGVLSGIIDGDGSINRKNNKCNIRLSSRKCISQLSYVLSYFNLCPSMTYYDGTQSKNENKLIQDSFPIFGVDFNVNEELINTSYKCKEINTYRRFSFYNVDDWNEIIKVKKIKNEKYLEANDYIYDITTDSHSFIMNNIWVHNCVSVTMYPFLFDGLTTIGGQASAPQHLSSFCGEFVNLVYSIASQFAGAVSTPEFITYLDYFIRKKYGDDYVSNLDKVVDLSLEKQTIKDVIYDCFNQIVYSINTPASARNYQPVFWNIAYFDKEYFEGILGDFIFPDMTVPKWETVDSLQRLFLNWFNNERLKELLTFPVETMNLLNDGNDCVDRNYKDLTAEMYSKGHSFFTYTSDSVDSLASCCFSGDQNCLTKTSDKVNLVSFKEFYESNYEESRKNFSVFHNGSWVKGKPIKLPSRQMYKITTSNKKEMYVTDNHIFPTIEGDKKVKNITTDDFLMFNSRKLDTFPEKDKGLTYSDGYFIGMYLGDGSCYVRNENRTPEIRLSLNENKYNDCKPFVLKMLSKFDSKANFLLSKPYNNVYPTIIRSWSVYNFIKEYVHGDYSYEKELDMSCLLQSYDFRRGILDGYYATDGGNSNRIYTTSKKLVEQVECLITSLGMNSVIDMSDRTGDGMVVIRGQEFNRNYPLYCIRWYNTLNKRSSGDIYKVKNNSEYFKVKTIEKIESNDEYVYCFEMKKEEEPYFTLPNGCITHNCRLKNEITDNVFSYTLGAGGVSTGSKGVITININRLVQNATKNGVDISDAVKEQVKKVHKYLKAFNAIIYDNFNSKMLPVYDAGYISLNKQYCTIGINGFVEGAEFLGIDISPNDEYFEYGEKILKPIFDENKSVRTKDFMVNTEFVPKMCGYKVA